MAQEPANGDYYTLYVGGEHYGFADFDYSTSIGIETETYLTLGKNYYVKLPFQAAHCFSAIVLFPLLVAVAVLFFMCRRKARANPSLRRLAAMSHPAAQSNRPKTGA